MARKPRFGSIVVWILAAMTLVLAIAIGWLSRKIVLGADVASVPRLQAATTDILLPFFEAILTALLGTGIIKGALTVQDNKSRVGDKQPISLFDW